MTEPIYNASFHPVTDELLEQFLSGNTKFTAEQKSLIRDQVLAANNAGIREYKVHFDGLNYVLIRNGQISGVDHDGSYWEKKREQPDQ